MKVSWEGVEVNVESKDIQEKIKRFILRKQKVGKRIDVPWTKDEKNEIIWEFNDLGMSFEEIAKKHNRTKASICSQLNLLGHTMKSRAETKKKLEEARTVTYTI